MVTKTTWPKTTPEQDAAYAELAATIQAGRDDAYRAGYDQGYAAGLAAAQRAAEEAASRPSPPRVDFVPQVINGADASGDQAPT